MTSGCRLSQLSQIEPAHGSNISNGQAKEARAIAPLSRRLIGLNNQSSCGKAPRPLLHGPWRSLHCAEAIEPLAQSRWIMKAKLLVHGSYARSITSPVEVARLLSQGWLLAMPKPRTKSAARMRMLREQRRSAGWLSLYLWLSPDEVEAITAVKRRGESYADLLMRLVNKQSLL